MKEIKDTRFLPVNDINVPDMLDMEVRTIDIRCPNCGRYMRFDECYVSEYQQMAIDSTIMRFNSFIDDLENAVIDLYGEDVKTVYLVKKFQELKNKHFKPKLSIVKGMEK